MSDKAVLRNEKTGELVSYKVGWSWVMFFCSGFFGIPLFLRGLNALGSMMIGLIGLQLATVALAKDEIQYVSYNVFWSLIFLVVAIYMGIRGNELTIKHLLTNGWTWDKPNSDAEIYLKNKWGSRV